MTKHVFVLITFLLGIFPLLFAQKASNADCYEKEKKIYITYSLDKEADITIMVSINDSSFQKISSSYLSGDFGMNVKPGLKKVIVWDVLKDRGGLIGDVKFKVLASESFNSFTKRIKNQKNKYYTKTSSYLYTLNGFYGTAGVADIALIEVGLGVTFKNQFVLPFNASFITFRYKIFEIAPVHFTYDLMHIADNPRQNLYWSPQARVVLPFNNKFAFVPSVGPSLDIFNTTWWFCITAHFRYYDSMLDGSYLDFYAGYENNGFTLGVSISYAIPIN